MGTPSTPTTTSSPSASPRLSPVRTTAAPDSSVTSFHRLSADLSQVTRNRAESGMWSSVRSPRLQQMPGIEADFDAALKMMIKSPIDPMEIPAVATMVGKTEVKAVDVKLTGLSTIRRHGQVMCADEEDVNVRRTAAHLFVGPVRMTFKLFYGSRKRRIEVTSEGIVFGVRIKADRDKRSMKLEKFAMQTFGLRIRLKGEKTWDPVANCLLRALNPLIRHKVRQMLEQHFEQQITEYQSKTSLKMIRMLYGIKEKPWSGLEGMFAGKSRK